MHPCSARAPHSPLLCVATLLLSPVWLLRLLLVFWTTLGTSSPTTTASSRTPAPTPVLTMTLPQLRPQLQLPLPRLRELLLLRAEGAVEEVLDDTVQADSTVEATDLETHPSSPSGQDHPRAGGEAANIPSRQSSTATLRRIRRVFANGSARLTSGSSGRRTTSPPTSWPWS